jgi:hypothetical protein
MSDNARINESQIPDDLPLNELQKGFTIENITKNQDKLDVIRNRCNISNINKNEIYTNSSVIYLTN